MRKINAVILSLVILNSVSFASEKARIIETNLNFAKKFKERSPKGFDVLLTSKGTSLVMLEPEQVSEFSDFIHEATGKCGGFFDVTNEAPVVTKQLASPPRYPQLGHKRSDVVDAIEEMHGSNIEIFTKRFSTNFATRRAGTKEGDAAAKWLAEAWSNMAISHEQENEIHVELVNPPRGYTQPNVRITIPGTDPDAPLVILGGHMDSINHKDGKLAPGVDDNASGIGALTEVYRMILKKHFRGKSTIQIFGYSAEEIGLLGSRSVAEYYSHNKVDVRAVLQMDMVAYPGKSNTVTFITDHVSGSLTSWTEQVYGLYIGEYSKRDRCGYACSDHASWDRYGYAAVFPFEAPDEEMNDNIHTSKDVWSDDLNAEHAVKFSKLAYAFAAILSTE